MVETLCAAIAAMVALTVAARRLRHGISHPHSAGPNLNPQHSWLIIPAGTALTALIAYIHREHPALIAICLFTIAAVIIAWIDWDTMLILDKMTYPLMGAMLAIAVVLWVVHDDAGFLTRSAAGLGIFAVIGFLDALFGSKGLGDVTLMAAGGALLGLLGWTSLVYGILGIYLTTAVFALIALATGGKGKEIPVGPYIAAGVIIATLF